MSKKTKDFNLQEFLDKKRRRKPFKIAAVFLAFAILIGGFVGVWSTGIIQEAIYNRQDLPDYVSYVDHTHSYKKTVVEPTCTEQGYTLYECRYCDMSYKQDYTATIDHDYQEVVLEQATTTSYGKAELVCSMCGDVKYEITLPLVGHTFTSEVVEPTCTEDGYTIHRSTDTDDVYIDEVIPATGHSMRLKDNYFYCETCGVMEYIEDCVAYGYTTRPVEYCYVDSMGVLYLAGNEHGVSWGTEWSELHVSYGEESLFHDAEKVVYLETVTAPILDCLADTVTEITFLGGILDGERMIFPDGVETVVIDTECDDLDIMGYGIKDLTITGKVKKVRFVCPSLEKIDLGEGIEEFCGADWGAVSCVIFPCSMKSVTVGSLSHSVEYYKRSNGDSSYDFDWSAYLGEGITWGQSPEEYLKNQEYAAEAGLWFIDENGIETVSYDYEASIGYSYEDCVIAWEAYQTYEDEISAPINQQPIFIVQEGTTTITVSGSEEATIFIPSTVKAVDVWSDCKIYYAGDQADALTVWDEDTDWTQYIVAYRAIYST